MNRVMRGENGVIGTPKHQQRLSVGLGTSAAIQLHPSGTPTNVLPRPGLDAMSSPFTRQHSGTPPSSEQHKEAGVLTSAVKRMSLHENLLLRILSTPSDQPLLRQNSSDAEPSQRSADESFDSCLSRSATPILDQLNDSSPDAVRCNTPEQPAGDGAVTNRHLQLLYRDLNSPSAAARIRALRALKSPTKRNAYSNFDVSYAEQDIITAEERVAPVARSIQEILSNVCVYVEVRSGSDNRSDGIKEHIASLGAKVNERLLKNTTHVIFKDGLLSTYQKAKKMNIPVVSVLWIEACKRHMCLMNPNDFQISNAERYDNPDLFKRMRRQKSMQPGAAETVGQKKRATAGTGKAAAAAKAPILLSPPSKLPVLHRLPKDDGLERIIKDFEAENQLADGGGGGGGTTNLPADEYDEMLQAAPLRMLEQLRSTPTALDSPAAAAVANKPMPLDDDFESTPKGAPSASENAASSRRTLFSLTDSGPAKQKRRPASSASASHRKTILFTPQMANFAEETVASAPSLEETRKDSGAKQNRRRTIAQKADDALPTPDLSFSSEAAAATVDKSARSRRKTIMPTVHQEGTAVETPTRTVVGVRTRRSSMVQGVGTENLSSTIRETPKGTEELTRSVLQDPSAISTNTNDPSTTNASVQNISPSVLCTSANESGKKQPALSSAARRRRKTVVLGNEENTPPSRVVVAAGFRQRANTQQRGTVFSPKDMDVSNVRKLGPGDGPQLAKVNSKGSEMSVVTPPAKNQQNLSGIPSNARQSSNRSSSVMSISSASVVSDRRRAYGTPGNSTYMEPLEISETPPAVSSQHSLSSTGADHNDGSSIVNRPNPTSSSTPIGGQSEVASSVSMRRKTLLQEYEEVLMFKSTRAPERRRRTIFDISMDIMDQRLSEINRQAAAAKRQSGCFSALPAKGAPVISSPPKDTVIQPAPASPSPAPPAPAPVLLSPPAQGAQKSLHEFYRKAIKSCEKQKDSSAASSSGLGEPSESAVVVPRKRKLFNIQATEEAPATSKTPHVERPIAPRLSKSTAKFTTKRRSVATVAVAAASGCTTAEPSRPASLESRRTTALFESHLAAPVEPKKRLFPVGRGLPTMASQQPQTTHQSQQARQFLATTNLHTEQATFVKEALAKLGGFIIEPDVTDNTTHLVTLEPRRTINMLRALVRGLWIIRYEWIVESFRARRWLPEERFEERDFSPAVQINRSERQAFGSQYRSELFADYGPFWISPRCEVPARQLRELLLLCRGKVTADRSKAKYLVMENDAEGEQEIQCKRPIAPVEGQTYTTALWILDSITGNKVRKLSSKYRIL